jgi:hypothetical protein
MVVWLSVPTQRVGIGDGFAVFFLGPDGLGQIFQVHLVADAGAGRDDAEIVKRAGPISGTRSARHCARIRARRFS